MIRFVLVMALVFALPFLAWRLRAAFSPVEAEAEVKPMPTGTLAVVGAVLALGSMIVLAAMSIDSSGSDGIYQPPRLDEGQISPGRFERSEPRPDPDQPSLER